MRQFSIESTRRRACARAIPARPPAAVARVVVWMRQRASRRNRRPRSAALSFAGMPLALLAALGLLLLTPAALVQASQGPARPAARLQPAPPAQPGQAQFSGIDTATGKRVSFSIQLKTEYATPTNQAVGQQPLHVRGEFSFTLPTGDVIHGGPNADHRPAIQGPDSNNMDTLDTTIYGGTVCQNGTLIAATPYAGQSATGAPLPAAPVHPVLYLLRAHFDDNGLVAYAHLSYVALDDPNYGAYVKQLCFGRQDTPNAGTLISGCPDFTGPCQQPLEMALARVASYDSDLLHAVNSGDWSAVYNDSTETITGQYSEQEFAAAINAQIPDAGKITAISPVTTVPTIQTGTVGTPFFSVTQTETISLNGNNSTRQVTSYFLLEGGEWRFWFSQSGQ